MNPLDTANNRASRSASPLRLAEAPPRPDSLERSDSSSFASLLSNAVQSASNAEHQAQQMMTDAVLGKEISEVEAMTAIKKADLSLRMMLQVRNSLLQAYDEIKSMQF